VYKLIYLLTFC